MQRVRTPDGRYRYSYASPGMREALALDPRPIVEGGNTDHAWIHKEDRPRFLAALERSAATLATCDEEVRVLGQDGRTRWVRSISHPRRLRDGSTVWDGIALDITERREAEGMLERLLSRTREAEEAQGKLAGSMARSVTRALERVRRMQAMALPPKVAEELAAMRAELEGAEPAAERTDLAVLSRRQRDVAAFLGQGLSNRDIARALGMSEGTAKLHVAAILKRLGVRNRAAAALALRAKADLS